MEARISKRLAAQQLRHDVGGPFRLSDIVDGDDVRVLERRDGLRLSTEAGQGGGISVVSSRSPRFPDPGSCPGLLMITCRDRTFAAPGLRGPSSAKCRQLETESLLAVRSAAVFPTTSSTPSAATSEDSLLPDCRLHRLRLGHPTRLL